MLDKYLFFDHLGSPKKIEIYLAKISLGSLSTSLPVDKYLKEKDNR